MVTICTFCGKSINEESEQNKGKKYLYCPCKHGMIPRGANSYNNKIEVKGGHINMAKNMKQEDKKKEKEMKKEKVTKEPKAEKEVVEKGPGKNAMRKDNARKVRDFLQNTLKLDQTEISKCLSCTYNSIKHEGLNF